MGYDAVNHAARVERENDFARVVDVQLNEVVQIVVRVEYQRARVERPDVDEDVLREETVEPHGTGRRQVRGVCLDERRSSAER